MVVCIQPVLFLKFWLIYKVRICMGHLTCSSVPFSCRGLCNDLSLYYYTHIRYSIFNIFLLLSLFYFSLLHVMILHSYFSIDNYEYLLHNITEFLLLFFSHAIRLDSAYNSSLWVPARIQPSLQTPRKRMLIRHWSLRTASLQGRQGLGVSVIRQEGRWICYLSSFVIWF